MPGMELIMKTDHLFNDKKILIWGYGREGKSTEKWLEGHTSPAAVEISSATPEEMLKGAGD
jgi:UDP-N-acetylmuramoylalanine--D-glutamate ligase